eukprot:530208-Amphidinium_carterae.1
MCALTLSFAAMLSEDRQSRQFQVENSIWSVVVMSGSDSMLAELWGDMFENLANDETDVVAQITEPGDNHGLIPLPHAASDAECHMSVELMSKLSSTQVELQNLFEESVSVLQVVLKCCLSSPDFHPSKDVEKVAELFLQRDAVLHASKQVLAAQCGVPHNLLETNLVVLVDILLHLEKLQRQHVEKLCTSGVGQALAVMDVSRYDETPMKVRVKQAFSVCFQSSGVGAGQGVDAADILELQGQLLQYMQQDAVLCKLFATENKFAVLVKLSHAGNSGCANVHDIHGTEYFLVEGQCLTHLQCLETASGHTIFSALLQNYSAAPNPAGKINFRLTCTDQAGSNYVAEQRLLERLGPDWVGFHTACNVHVVSRSLGKTMALVDEHITGLLHFSLALGTGSAMGKFRHAMVCVLMQRPFVVVRGYPSLDLIQYKNFILKLFGDSGTQKSTRKHLLSTVATGDWRKSSELEVYVAPGLSYDEAELRMLVIKGIVVALASRVFAKYPRHRWTGCDISTDQFGLLESVHALGSSTIKFMKAGKGHYQGKPDSSDMMSSDVAANLSAQDLTHVDDEEVPAIGVGMPDSSTMQENTEGGNEFGYAALNAKYFNSAHAWLQTNPLGHVMLLRLCMTPLVKLLSEYLTRGGEDWQVQQLASHCQQGGAGPTSLTSSFMAYIALTSEQVFFKSLVELLESSCWGFLPCHVFTIKMQNLAFKMISRMGALIWQLLVVPTQLCPLRIFRLLLAKSVTEKYLQRLPVCMQCPLTKTLLKHYGNNLLSEDMLMILRALAEQQRCETVQLEWGHGRVNRLLSVQRQHTHAPSLEYLNARFVAQKYQGRVANLKKRGSKVPCAVASEQDMAAHDIDKNLPKSRGGGGAWRAMVSETQKGRCGRVNFAELQQVYVRAKADNSEDYQRWVQMGKAATVKHKLHAGSAFGPGRRHVLRSFAKESVKAKAKSKLAALSATHTALQQDVPGVHLQKSTLGNMNMKQELAKVRSLSLQEAKSRRAESMELKHKLQEYVAATEVDEKQKLVSAIPALTDCLDHVHYVPHAELHRFIMHLNQDLNPVVNLASWAQQEARSSNVQKFLRQDWQCRNLPILDASEQKKKAKLGASPCLQQGCCTCQPETVHLKGLHKRLMDSLRHIIVEVGKGLVHNACICLELVPTKKVCHAAELETLLSEDVLEASQEKFGVESSTWLHLALMYYKPFRPTYQVLSRVGANSDHIVLQMTSRWITAWEVIAHMDLGAEWEVQYYVMLETEAPVASLDPSTCYVKKPCLGNSLSLWPLPRRGRKRGKTKHATQRSRTNKKSHSSAVEVQGLPSQLAAASAPQTSADNEVDFSGTDSSSTQADDPVEDEQ